MSFYNHIKLQFNKISISHIPSTMYDPYVYFTSISGKHNTMIYIQQRFYCLSQNDQEGKRNILPSRRIIVTLTKQHYPHRPIFHTLKAVQQTSSISHYTSSSIFMISGYKLQLSNGHNALQQMIPTQGEVKKTRLIDKMDPIFTFYVGCKDILSDVWLQKNEYRRIRWDLYVYIQVYQSRQINHGYDILGHL